MNNKVMGFVIILLGGSLLMNIFAYSSVTSTSKKVTEIQKKYEKEYQKQDKKIETLNNYIDTNTSAPLEKTAEEKKIIESVLYGLFEYTPKTKEARYSKIEPLMTPEVYEKLAPPKLDKEPAEEETDHNHSYKIVDEQETVSIKDITYYAAFNGDYLVKYTLTYQFPEREELSYTALTRIKVNKNVISHWDQHTIEFEE